MSIENPFEDEDESKSRVSWVSYLVVGILAAGVLLAAWDKLQAWYRAF